MGDTSEGTSCPSAIGLALQDMYNKIKDNSIVDIDDEKFEDEFIIDEDEINEMRCPECGSKLEQSGGCVICKGDETHPGCGWSKCD